MQTSPITTKHGDKLRDAFNIKEKPNSTYLTREQEIEHTPFKMVEIQNEDETYSYFASLGKYAITPKSRTEQEVLTYLDENYWHVTLACIVAWQLNHNDIINLDKSKKPLT